MNINNACLCGSGLDYPACCGAFHSGKHIPATAEALMRSRYSAYALANAPYLQATWLARECPKTIDFTNDAVTWLKLEIIATKKGGIKDSKGLVSFNAHYRQAGEDHVMSEVSRFIKIKGRWFYVDGVVKSL